MSRGTLTQDKPKPTPSPFVHAKPISDPARFVGRKEETEEIFNLLRAPGFGSSSVVGERQSGKTSLLNYVSHPDVVKRHGLDPESCLFINLDLSTFTSASAPAQFYEYMLTRIAARVQDNALIEQIKRLHKEERIGAYDLDELFDTVDDLGLKVMLLLDDFQNVGNNANFRLDFLYGLRSLTTRHSLALITTSRGELTDMSRDDAMRSSPWHNIFTTIFLRPFSRADVDDMLPAYLRDTGVTFTQAEITQVLSVAGGTPFLLQLGFDHLYAAHQTESDEERRLSVVTAKFEEAASSYLGSCWARCSEREKTVLAMLTVLAGRQQGKPSYWKGSQLESWYLHAESTLSDLVARGLVSRTADRYALSSNFIYRWIARELSAPSSDAGDGEHSYESRIGVSLPPQEAEPVLT